MLTFIVEEQMKICVTN